MANNNNSNSNKTTKVDNVKKTKLSLKDLFEYHLSQAEESDRELLLEYGVVLTIGLSGAEQRASKKGADTYGGFNGYVTLPAASDDAVVVPFLVSSNAFGVTMEEDKVKLIRYDHAGHMEEGLEEYKLNWRVNLNDAFLKQVLNTSENKKLWSKFVTAITENKKVQLQILVALESGEEGKGKVQTYSPALKNKTQQKSIRMDVNSKEIYHAELVFPGSKYLDKVDRPVAMMAKLKGTKVSDEIKVVSPFAGIVKDLKAKKEKEELKKVAQETQETVLEESKEDTSNGLSFGDFLNSEEATTDKPKATTLNAPSNVSSIDDEDEDEAFNI